MGSVSSCDNGKRNMTLKVCNGCKKPFLPTGQERNGGNAGSCSAKCADKVMRKQYPDYIKRKICKSCGETKKVAEFAFGGGSYQRKENCLECSPNSTKRRKFAPLNNQDKASSYKINVIQDGLLNPYDLPINSVELPGVYFLFYKSKLVYVGQSHNIHARVLSHKPEKRFDSYSFTTVTNSEARLSLERDYINKYRPKLNVMSNPNMRKSLPKKTIVDCASVIREVNSGKYQ